MTYKLTILTSVRRNFAPNNSFTAYKLNFYMHINIAYCIKINKIYAAEAII
jgi:hypothetical protein